MLEASKIQSILYSPSRHVFSKHCCIVEFLKLLSSRPWCISRFLCWLSLFCWAPFPSSSLQPFHDPSCFYWFPAPLRSSSTSASLIISLPPKMDCRWLAARTNPAPERIPFGNHYWSLTSGSNREGDLHGTTRAFRKRNVFVNNNGLLTQQPSGLVVCPILDVCQQYGTTCSVFEYHYYVQYASPLLGC